MFLSGGNVFMDRAIKDADEVKRLFSMVPVRALAQRHWIRNRCHLWRHLKIK